MITMPPVEMLSFRRVCGAFPTGVTVVTCPRPDGGVHGMTANSFLSVSLDPLLMLVSVDRGAAMCQAMDIAAGFAVSILAEGQSDVSNHFAGRRVDLSGPLFTSVDESPWANVVTGAAGWMVLDKHQALDVGDHRLFVGAPTAVASSFRAPLVFHGGRYHALHNGFETYLPPFL